MDGCRGVSNTFPTHNQIPESIPGLRPVFHAYFNQDNKAKQIQVTNHTFNFPMIGGDSKSRVVYPHCHVYEHAGTHTHTQMHMFTQYIHSSTQHTRNEISSSPMGSELGNLKSILKLEKQIGGKTIFPALTISSWPLYLEVLCLVESLVTQIST